MVPYKDIKSPEEKKQILTAELNRILPILIAYDPEKIILFGSMARGDIKITSDIDILMIKNGTDDYFEHKRRLRELGYKPQECIDLAIKTQETVDDPDIDIYTTIKKKV